MITIIDYGLGNLGSVKNALDTLGANSIISSKQSDIEKADGLILPGVGAAKEGMKNVKERKLDLFIKQEVQKGKPILGICLGMQLLMNKSEEGNVSCLGIVEGVVEKFRLRLKIPQIGWNTVEINDYAPLFRGILQSSYFYFVHSYYCSPPADLSIGTTKYGTQFCSALQKQNIYGVQFHPEKSGANGLQLLKNYIDILYENYSSD